jgi:hypothetical protein
MTNIKWLTHFFPRQDEARFDQVSAAQLRPIKWEMRFTQCAQIGDFGGIRCLDTFIGQGWQA